MRGALLPQDEILLGQHSLRYKVWRKIGFGLLTLSGEPAAKCLDMKE